MKNELSQQMMKTAKWMADLMKADGITPAEFSAMPSEMIEAYGDAIAKKIEAIQAIYLTRQGAKQAMADRVLAISP